MSLYAPRGPRPIWVQKGRFVRNHLYFECDREQTGTKTEKVRKLVVIYIPSNPCSTTQVHCIHRVPVRTTWSETDSGSESDQNDGLERNHQHLDSDREEAGTEMGKVRKLVVIYIRSLY